MMNFTMPFMGEALGAMTARSDAPLGPVCEKGRWA
jgi:hypothetical protein